MTRITLDHLDPDVEHFIAARAADSGASPDEVVLELLRLAARATAPHNGPIGNQLDRFAGGWSEEEYKRFLTDTRVFNQVDDEMWR